MTKARVALVTGGACEGGWANHPSGASRVAWRYCSCSFFSRSSGGHPQLLPDTDCDGCGRGHQRHHQNPTAAWPGLQEPAL